MLHDIMSNPWRVEDSDNEEHVDHRLYRRLSFTPQAPLPNMAARPSVPRIAEWAPVATTDRHKKIFGPKKTTPSFEKEPTNHKPIFCGTRDLRSSLSIRERDDFNSSMVTSSLRRPPSPPSPPAVDDSSFDPLLVLQENMNTFIYAHIPKCYPSFIHCCLRRDRTGIQKGFYPTFYMQFERPPDGKKIFLLAARKVARLDRQSEYVITTNVETLSDKSGGPGYIGKLRESNVTGTEYTLYDNGKSPNKDDRKNTNCKNELRRELAGIIYNNNMFGLKGPRQMKVVLPQLQHDIQPAEDEDTILDRWRERNFSDVFQLQNRVPKYNEVTKQHVLEFQDHRVVRSSIKNFQMILNNENHQQEIVMQFGRVDDDTFICDYRHPLSAIQAFGIALSSFDKRIARD